MKRSVKKLLEYIWLDANDNLRSKIKIENNSNDEIPVWNFDGSSTGQSECEISDIILKPVRTYKNPFFTKYTDHFKGEAYIVLCECLNPDLTPHITNHRPDCVETRIKHLDEECLFGIEQEYVIYERGKPYNWHTYTKPLENISDCVQGEFYCSVGSNKAFGRAISDKHLIYCLDAGINICGTNAEVAPSQWEFQIGTCDMLTVSDDLITARYILNKIAEENNCYISLDPKPYGTNWNGSGGHTNFSTIKMRGESGIKFIFDACGKLIGKHDEHMKIYGKNNELRLTGKHETSSMTECSYGIANRGSSIRIPLAVKINQCGYLEDRRPAANLNPYLVTTAIVKTVCS